LGNAKGDPAHQDIEDRLAGKPVIRVPAIVLHGRDDGVDPPSDDDSDRPRFTGAHERQIISGTGHNLPQEAPDAFASAVLSIA
jgi:pimeloyl-ACP methyl ester carboxylesterase